jgi:hypothetical protein
MCLAQVGKLCPRGEKKGCMAVESGDGYRDGDAGAFAWVAVDSNAAL